MTTAIATWSAILLLAQSLPQQPGKSDVSLHCTMMEIGGAGEKAAQAQEFLVLYHKQDADTYTLNPRQFNFLGLDDILPDREFELRGDKFGIHLKAIGTTEASGFIYDEGIPVRDGHMAFVYEGDVNNRTHTGYCRKYSSLADEI